MCLNFDDIVAKDGSFDGVPPPRITFENYNSIMNSGDVSRVSNKNAIYNAR